MPLPLTLVIGSQHMCSRQDVTKHWWPAVCTPAKHTLEIDTPDPDKAHTCCATSWIAQN